MKNYYRIMLGKSSTYAKECYDGNFIGVDFLSDIDLTGKLPEDWRNFNQQYIPVVLKRDPGRSKISAGLACGMLWTIAKGIKVGDTVLCPNGTGSYYVGEVLDNYSYHAGEILPHRRTVKWLPATIQRAEMSDPLQKSTGSIGTSSMVTGYAEEIERLIAGQAKPTIISTDATVEDPATFALEKHLEDFLVQNWKQTELGKQYDIYTNEDGEEVGRQFPSDTGPIDVLAISKDRKEWLVVELKKGRASDNVVGQILRYMGYVQELAEAGQKVKGVIIALEDDNRIRKALSMTPDIEFYRYQVTFKLFKD
jgi:restriction system protein